MIFNLTFIDNMLENTKVEWLKSSLSTFGRVMDADIFPLLSRRKGESKCFGFGRVRERRIALNVVAAMNGSSLQTAG